jgi:hypothetical protein
MAAIDKFEVLIKNLLLFLAGEEEGKDSKSYKRIKHLVGKFISDKLNWII